MQPTARARMRRLSALGSMGSLIFVVAVMALSPAATATNSATTLTLTHPYKTLGASLQSSSSKSGCGKFKQTIAPAWSKGTGVYRTAGSATATNCVAPAVGNVAQWYTYMNLERDFKFTSTSAHNVNVTFTVDMAATESVTPFSSCKVNYKATLSECLVDAGVEVYTYTYIFDETNFSYSMGFTTLATNYSTVENYSQYYNCGAAAPCHSFGNYSTPTLSNTFSGVLTGNTSFSTGTQPIVRSHTYELEVTVLVEAFAEVEVQDAKATGAGSATASVDVGSSGRGITINSIVIS